MSTSDLPEEDGSSTTAPQQRWRWVLGGGVAAAVGVGVIWAYTTGRTPESVLWFIGAQVLLVPIFAYAVIRWKYGLKGREASRGVLTGLVFMTVCALPIGLVFLLENPLRGHFLAALAVSLAGLAWLHTRRRTAAAGPIILEVADLGTRRWAIPGALFGVIAAVNNGLMADSVLERVFAVGVAIIVVVAGFRARSATFAFRERGIASFAGVIGWEEIEDVGWSPGAEATLTLTMSSRFLPSRRGPLRIPPDAREAVSKLLGERLRSHGDARASTAAAAEAPT